MRTRPVRTLLIALAMSAAATLPVPSPTSAAGPSPKRILAVAQVGTAADVPWYRVGRGWFLTMVNEGTRDASGIRVDHQELELVDPLGGRYRMLRRPVNSAGNSYLRLTDWSADAQVALLVADLGTRDARAIRYDLKFGTRHATPLAADITTAALGPVGELYATAYDGTVGSRVSRVDLDGRSRVIARHTSGLTLPRPDGTRIVVAPLSRSAHQFRVISSRGRLIHTLDVPQSCSPSRNWMQTSVLASCSRNGATRLFRVPVDGEAPVAISGNHGAGSVDLGDVDARRLHHSTYLEASSSGGQLILVRQRSGGHVVRVDVPATQGDVFLLGTSRGRLVLRTGAPQSGVPDEISLFDPDGHRNRTVTTLHLNQEFATVLAFGERRAMIG
jgi:hypothetical protein